MSTLLRRLSLACLVALAGCGDATTGPVEPEGEVFQARLAVVASVRGPARVPQALRPATLEATAFEADGRTVAADTTLDVTPGEEVEVSLGVQVEEPSQTFLVEIVLRNAGGAEVYRSAPTPVAARAPGSGGNPPATLVLSYSGPGAGATRLEVSPEETLLRFGRTTALEVAAFGPDGTALGAIPVDWSTLDPDVLTLTDAETGLWRAGEARGTARVVAAFPPTGLVDTARVRVRPPPAGLTVVSGDAQEGSAGDRLPDPVVVSVEGADGRPLDGEEVVFEASGGGSAEPATVRTDAEGRAAAVWTLGPELGEQALVARVVAEPGPSATASAEAGPAALARIVVTPDEIAFDAVTATRTLSVAGFDTFGNPVPFTDLGWTTSDPAVATVSASGVVTAGGNGSAEIRAVSGGVASAPVPVVVEQVAVGATITPSEGWEIAIGELRTFRATARDRLDQVVPDRTFTWSSSDSGVLAVDAGGRATGVGLGSATVTAALADDPTLRATSAGTVVEPAPDAASGVTTTPVFVEETFFTGFQVSWNDASDDEDRFELERSLDLGGSWQRVAAELPAGSTSAFDGGPEVWPLDRRAIHRVRACSGSRCSGWSLGAPSVTPPFSPAELGGTWLSTPGTLRVSWTDINTWESGYRVRLLERTCSGTFPAGTVTVGPSVTSVEVPDLTDEGDYDVRVEAFNSAGASEPVLLSLGPGPFCED